MLDHAVAQALHTARPGALPWERLAPVGRWRLAVQAIPTRRALTAAGLLRTDST